jgi:periplasmic divalent cation tolerance protein
MEREVRVIFMTAPSDDVAARIARALVEEGLAACVNIVPTVRSVYLWKGEIVDEREVLMVAKTTDTRFGDLMRRVRALHPYSVPEIIALPVVDGNEDYLRWVVGENTGEE